TISVVIHAFFCLVHLFLCLCVFPMSLFISLLCVSYLQSLNCLLQLYSVSCLVPSRNDALLHLMYFMCASEKLALQPYNHSIIYNILAYSQTNKM
uniref:Secreted protein n=1 Tax=Electrophorus electricus TaxID=8005 RepID=A0AAY5EX32_ELEEL